MKYLYDNLNRVTPRFANHRLFLFFDYDGTLMPIVQKPQDAKLPPKTRAILRRLTQRPDFKVAIISGRSLSKIKKLVCLKNVIYAGNHGFQVNGPETKFNVPLPVNYKKTLPRLKTGLRKHLSAFEGVWFEDKDVCFAIHYRLVAKKNIPAVKSIFNEVVAPYLVENKIRVTAGKMLCEIRPPVDWHKGKVVKWLLNKYPHSNGGRAVLPIYIGDDLTDEDAFKVLKNFGLTIVVGKTTRSNAEYFVRDTNEVAEFLKIILKLIRKG